MHANVQVVLSMPELPRSVPGTTVVLQCLSGLECVAQVSLPGGLLPKPSTPMLDPGGAAD